jgi:hypothetical protein
MVHAGKPHVSIGTTLLLVLQADAAISHCLPSSQRGCRRKPAMPMMSGQLQLNGSSTLLAHRLPASVLLKCWSGLQVMQYGALLAYPFYHACRSPDLQPSTAAHAL